MTGMYACAKLTVGAGYGTDAAEEQLPIVVDPFVEKVVCGENREDEEAERGLVEEEPQFDSNGLIERPDKLWKLIAS